MPPEERDRAWLLDMLLEAQYASEAIHGLSKEAFLADWRVQHIAARCIELIGEAANRVSAEFQENHADIPWSKVIGIRNILIHHYHRVDYELLWEVIQSDLPALITQLLLLVPPDNESA